MRTLIILDWDDTLFPTTWVMKNYINLNERDRYTSYFSKLDKILYKLLSDLMYYGRVVVVTNAMLRWVEQSSNIIPNTQGLIKSKIKVISAREQFKDTLPDQNNMWKKLIFDGIVRRAIGRPNNIVSVGDAEYEFDALMHLYNKYMDEDWLLKSIRFMRMPSYDSLIDQLEVFSNNVHKIIRTKKHMDLQFNDLNKDGNKK